MKITDAGLVSCELENYLIHHLDKELRRKRRKRRKKKHEYKRKIQTHSKLGKC